MKVSNSILGCYYARIWLILNLNTSGVKSQFIFSRMMKSRMKLLKTSKLTFDRRGFWFVKVISVISVFLNKLFLNNPKTESVCVCDWHFINLLCLCLSLFSFVLFLNPNFCQSLVLWVNRLENPQETLLLLLGQPRGLKEPCCIRSMQSCEPTKVCLIIYLCFSSV